jgi:hypothetical protein
MATTHPSNGRTSLIGATSRDWARRVVAVVGLAAALLPATPVAAQAKDPAAAEALFREGRLLSDAGDIAGACAKFRESDRLDPAVGTTFNIADCEERLGRLARAWTLFDEVAQRLPATDKRRTVAAQRAAALEPRLPKLSIRLAGASPSSARVVRDGVELGAASLGTPLPVDPGEHVVVVSAPGRVERAFKVIVSEREIRTLEVAAGAPSDEPSPSGEGPTQPARVVSRGNSPTLGYVLGGIGVAGFVTGAVAGVLVLQKKSTVEEHCDTNKRCDDEGLDAAKSGRTLGLVTTIGLVTGVVGVGAGTYLIVSAGSRQDAAAASLALGGRF